MTTTRSTTRTTRSPRARRALALAAAGVGLTVGLAAPASAHTQIVQPPAHESPVVFGPISKAWAQAHCNAASPEVVYEASGVVQFAPGTSLPCPPVPNPGGQVHP